MKRALVTGGCGFLGAALVRELIGQGVGVRVLALPGEGTENVDGLPLELVRGNVLAPEECALAVEGVDTVFHVAALYKDWFTDPMPMYDVNLRGTFNVLEACRRAGVARVVMTSSTTALGRPRPGTVGDEDTPYEAWDLDFTYGRTKLLSQRLAEDFARWGLDVRVVCPSVIFGPGDVAPTPSGKLLIEALKGGPALWFDGGSAYVDVRDAARVHVLAAERGRAGQRYIASGHNLGNREFILALDRAAGRRRTPRHLPTALARAAVIGMEAVARRTGTPPRLTRTFFEYSLVPMHFSNEKSVRELGATYRPLDETLADAVAWFRGRGLG